MCECDNYECYHARSQSANSLLRRVSDLPTRVLAPRIYEFSIALVVVKIRESVNCTESSESKKWSLTFQHRLFPPFSLFLSLSLYLSISILITCLPASFPFALFFLLSSSLRVFALEWYLVPRNKLRGSLQRVKVGQSVAGPEKHQDELKRWVHEQRTCK